MQVRKFEAKNMKEALELVKQHLGPEAIILSAKDNSRGFGLMGERSVEVTAAVSEEVLLRKHQAEKKLGAGQKDRYAAAPARMQKQFIEKVYEQRNYQAQVQQSIQQNRQQARGPARPQQNVHSVFPQTTRYIDIIDEEQQTAASAQRIRDAARAAQTASAVWVEKKPNVPAVVQRTSAPQAPQRVMALEAQISELKTMLETFKNVPQTFTTSHPGAEEGLPYELSLAYQKLRTAGVQTSVIVEWLKTAKADLDREQIKKAHLVDAWLVQKVMSEAVIAKDPLNARYHCFIGTTGQGKTTTLVKLASQLVMKEKKRIALVSLDTLKVGASDQLKLYAQILNVPFAIVRTPGEWALLEEKVKDVHHILVDAPGINLRSMEEMEWLKALLPPAAQRKTHFVQSALARDEECFEIASRYQMIGFDDVIFTRLDESVQHGLIINFQKQFRAPIHSFGTGTAIPEDLEWASKERVADLIFKISKIRRREATV
jgi:flagellar biosynthesis protein FlhF